MANLISKSKSVENIYFKYNFFYKERTGIHMVKFQTEDFLERPRQLLHVPKKPTCNARA